MQHRRRAGVGGATMKLRFTAVLMCGLSLATAATAQLQPDAYVATNQTTNGPCPSPAEGKTAWFDTCRYLLLGNGVKAGRALSIPDPEYSESARKAKIKGTVFLAVALNATGTVDAVKVVRSVGPGLDQNAVDAVRQWKFAPATKDGKPVAVQIEVTVGFDMY
jgi:TonB family protein